MKVSLFVTCLCDAIFPETARATVKVLRRLGCEVEFDHRQTCCGQMHLNSGYLDQALPLIRRHIELFQSSEVVVSPSASCVAMIRESYLHVAEWADDKELHARAQELASKTYELSEFLVKKLKLEDVGATFPHRVCYHPSCHGLRTLNVGEAPITLLKSVNKLTLVDLPNAEECCGFGGTFSIKNAETSSAILGSKCERILGTQAEYVAALDRSCLMHIGGGLSRLEVPTKIIHLAEILASEEVR